MGLGSTAEQGALLDAFLKPMSIDTETCHVLSQGFLQNFLYLSAESLDQFLPTPISESILRPVADHGHGRHLAIDLGGTNLRVGFVELLADEPAQVDINSITNNGTKERSGNGSSGRSSPFASSSRLKRHLERSWPIANHLKNDNADSLFVWIAECIAEVVEGGCRAFNLPNDVPLPLGITFSFPAEQPSVEKAIITSMGKGFAIPPNVELGDRLTRAYEQRRNSQLPPIHVVAIANDTVATLISFIFNYDGIAHRRAAMGLILGTGSNATVPLKLSLLHPRKRPQNINLLPGEKVEDAKIAVNTEWSINGTAAPMRELGLITSWDDELSAKNEQPGFQPLEYMTAGRYLGELGRIMLLDYMVNVLKVSPTSLPAKILQQNSLTTTFLSHFSPRPGTNLLALLTAEFPPLSTADFVWSEHHAQALYRIAKAIEVRAAGIIAAAILALLTLGEELPAEGCGWSDRSIRELGVGYTGGCIAHFQDYLADCQDFLDQLLDKRFGSGSPLRVVLSPCHDGGTTGAGILVAAALSSQASRT